MLPLVLANLLPLSRRKRSPFSPILTPTELTGRELLRRRLADYFDLRMARNGEDPCMQAHIDALLAGLATAYLASVPDGYEPDAALYLRAQNAMLNTAFDLPDMTNILVLTDEHDDTIPVGVVVLHEVAIETAERAWLCVSAGVGLRPGHPAVVIFQSPNRVAAQPAFDDEFPAGPDDVVGLSYQLYLPAIWSVAERAGICV